MELDLSALEFDPKNANKGTDRGKKALAQSLKEYGAGRSILLDKKGRIIAGNKTVEQALAAGHKDVLVIKTDGTKLVAVQRVDLDLDSQKAKALAIADNRVAELDLEWDAEVLADLSKDLDLSFLWSAGELEKLLGPSEDSDAPEPKIDQAAELQKQWKTRPRQLWAIPSLSGKGNHQLLCGDCTGADVKLLLGKSKADACITDPPYNVDVEYGDSSSDSKEVSAYRQFTEKWFEIARASSPQVLLTPGTGRGPGMPNLQLWFQMKRPDWILVWVKRNTVGHSSLGGFNAWEPIFFYGKPKKKIPQDIYDIPLTVQQDVAAEDGAKLHPTPKQAKLWAAMITDFTDSGDLIYEPFSGSGTCLVAAEQTGRRCYAIEIEPKYVAVALERLSEMGLKPKLAR